LSNPLSRRDALRATAGIAAVAAVPSLAFAQETPMWRLGFANAPAEGYADAAMTLIHGRPPAGLSGRLYRNGPAWFRYPDGSAMTHWFDGDGLIRRFALDGGHARFAGRFVDTFKRRTEQRLQRAVMAGFGTAENGAPRLSNTDDTNAANTSVLPVGGRIWALWEAGSPFAVDPDTLDSNGPITLRPDLAHMPFLAHPKVEPSGRIWNIGIHGARAIVWRLSPEGALEDAQLLTLPRADYIHDWAMTDRHLLFLLQPWTMTSARPPFIESLRWDGSAPFIVLVVDKDDFSRRRTFEAPAMAFFHTGDAFEEADGTIRVDLCAFANPCWATSHARDYLVGANPEASPKPELIQLALRPNGKADVIRSGLSGEFPQTDRRRQGLRRALTAIVADPAPNRPGETGVALMDWETGRQDRFDFGQDQMVEEMLVVPYGPGERQCWLVGSSLNLKARATELHVLDAANIAAGPVCSWRSRYAVPLGFHGAFLQR
jgi:carotenoid cleavage dioxygenase-like enzyme